MRSSTFAQGWVEVFPHRDEYGRDILDLPGFSTESYHALGGTALPHVVESRAGDGPRSLPEGLPEADAEGRHGELAPEGGGLPPQGPTGNLGCRPARRQIVWP